MSERKRFPILKSDEPRRLSIPWDVVAPHQAQAYTNHWQTLERLASRGGLTYDELWSVIYGLPWAKADADARRARGKALVQEVLRDEEAGHVFIARCAYCLNSQLHCVGFAGEGPWYRRLNLTCSVCLTHLRGLPPPATLTAKSQGCLCPQIPGRFVRIQLYESCPMHGSMAPAWLCGGAA